MADKLTYADKVGVVPKETHINQVWDDDMNEIKSKFNNNADLLETVEQETDVNTLDIIDLKNNKAEKDIIVIKAVDYSANINEYVLVNTTTGDITITLPDATLNVGKRVNVAKTDVTESNVIIDTVLSQTINGSNSVRIINQYTNGTFVSDGNNWIIN